MEGQQKEYQVEKLAAQAKSYVPEWKFSTEHPDAGSVTAILVNRMLADSMKRYDQVLYKHKIQYLNLFDRLKEEPIESAKSYVRFALAGGVEFPVHVPKGTVLLADTQEGTRQLRFESAYGITATAARLSRVYAVDGQSDRIVCLMGEEQDPEEQLFSAFDLSEENQARHCLLLGFDRAFDEFGGQVIGLDVSTVDPGDREEALRMLSEEDVSYSLVGQDSEQLLPRPTLENGCLWLSLADCQPQKVLWQGSECYLLCIRANRVFQVEVTGLRLRLSGQNIPAEEVMLGGVTQNPNRFLPFGSPMEIYAECGIECKAVFAQRGAQVRMEFELDFVELEQKLPEAANETEYRVIMKKEAQLPKAEISKIFANEVLLEYYTERGWKRLLQEEHVTQLFNGSTKGTVAITFSCPRELSEDLSLSGGYRMRLRLMRADNLYRMPCIQFCPVISGLRFSYSYDQHGLLPDRAVTENNFESVDVGGLWDKERSVSLFYTRELKSACMYLGFEGNPQGSPLSLYFEVENNEDQPLDYTVEYLGKDGFSPVQTADHTGGLLYSGSMLLLIPSDAQEATLFGECCHWLRIVCHNDLRERIGLPVIHRVLTNMVRVENQRTRSENFFVDDVDVAIRLELDEQNLLRAKVYVNERGADAQTENWVLWEKRTREVQQGRYYTIDLAAGMVQFDKGCFATYPLCEDGPSIRVDYQSYQGSGANVPAGSITTMAQPVKYIAEISNPTPAYGGYDGYNEETSAAIISNMLRTRGRAVSNRDYFDMISQISYGVRKIKCCSGIDRAGKSAEDIITIALLIDEYDKGSHIFSSVKDDIRQKLLASSSILPLGKTLVLCQPHFIKFSVRIWLQCGGMENVYDLQKQTEQDIASFIDPLTGGFGGNGWEIGTLPTIQQLVAYLKMKRRGICVERAAMSARIGKNEFAVDDDIYTRVQSPFAMALSGKHTVYVEIR